MTSESFTSDNTNNPLQNNAINLRQASRSDLGAVNEVITAAMDTWNLPARVKRISLPLYRYDEHDLEQMQILLAESGDTGIQGIAALELDDANDSSVTSILHGLYVVPEQHHKGIGTILLKAIEKMAYSNGAEALLVKARPEAVSFFHSRGFKKLPVKDDLRDYSYRLRKNFEEPF